MAMHVLMMAFVLLYQVLDHVSNTLEALNFIHVCVSQPQMAPFPQKNKLMPSFLKALELLRHAR